MLIERSFKTTAIMKIYKLLLSTTCFLVAMLGGIAGTMTFQQMNLPTAQYDGSRTRLIRSDQELTVGIDTSAFIGSVNATGSLRMVFYFDLSGLPEGSKITNANLALRMRNVDGNSVTKDVSLGVYELTEAFTPTQVTWKNAATGTAWTTPGGTTGALLASVNRNTKDSSPVIFFASTPDFVSKAQDAFDGGKLLYMVVKAPDQEGTGQRALIDVYGASGTTVNAPSLTIEFEEQVRNSEHFLTYEHKGSADISVVKNSAPVTLQYSIAKDANPQGFLLGWTSEEWWLPTAASFNKLSLKYKVLAVEGVNVKLVVKAHRRLSGQSDYWRKEVLLTATTADFVEMTVSAADPFTAGSENNPAWGNVNYLEFSLVGDADSSLIIQIQSPQVLDSGNAVISSIWQQSRTVDGGADAYQNLPQFFRQDSDNTGVGSALATGRGMFLIGRGSNILDSDIGRDTLLQLKADIGNFGIAGNISFPSLSRSQKWLQDNLAGTVYQQGGAYGLSEYISDAQAWLTSADGQSRNTTPGLGGTVGMTKYFDLGSPAVWSAYDLLLDRVARTQIKEFQLIETYWPAIPASGGFWGHGENELANLRDSLNGNDTADRPSLLKDGTMAPAGFWDYFEMRHGFRWTPADLGCEAGWADFRPTTKRAPSLIDDAESQEKKRYILMSTLAAYQVIKFYQRIGRSAYETDGRGIKLAVIPNKDNYGNSFDSLAYQSGPYPHVIGHEYFGNPKHFTAYERGPVLRRMYSNSDTAGTPKEQRIVLETSVTGLGSGEPYWASQVAYLTSYDLTASQEPDSMENDWLNWIDSEITMENPMLTRRYNDFAAKALAFSDARANVARRPLSGEPGSEGFFALLHTSDINKAQLAVTPGYHIKDAAASLHYPMLQLDLAQVRGMGNFDRMPDILVDDAAYHLAAEVEWIYDWLKQSVDRVFVANGFALGKIPDGENYFEGWTSFYEPNAASQTTVLLGSDLQASGVETFTSAPVSAQGDWTADTRFDGLTINGDATLYTYATADDVLLSANGKPLVSKKTIVGDDSLPKGILYYVHFLPGKGNTREVEKAILSKILDSKLRQDFLPVDAANDPIDNYKLRRYRTTDGITVVAYHPRALDNFNFVYDTTAVQLLPYEDEDCVGSFKVRLPADMAVSGDNTVMAVNMLTGEPLNLAVETIGTDNYVQLGLTGQSCGLWQIVGTSQAASDAYVTRAVEIGEIAFGAVPTPPYITTDLPETLQVEVGDPIVLTVKANGTQPLLYQWMKNGQVIENETTSTLSIASAQPSHGGVYSVVVSNDIGDPAVSRSSLVQVGDYLVPIITDQPAANQPVVDRGSVSIGVSVTGHPAPTLSWQVSEDGVTWTTITASTNPSLYSISSDGSVLTLINVNSAMNGWKYRCIAQNEVDTITSDTTTLVVKPSLYARPSGIVFDTTGVLYITDSELHTVHRVTTAGVSGILAGVSGAPSVVNGPGSEAKFDTPRGIHIHNNSLIVADSGNSLFRSISTNNGTVSAYVGPLAGLLNASGLTSDTIGVVITDSGNHVIARRSSTDVVTVFAGSKGQSGFVDGPGADARFNKPTGITFGSDGKFYIADTGNNAIRVLARGGSGWEVSTLVDADDGLNAPRGIVASGSGADMVLYVADTGNSVICEITLDGVVTPLTGHPGIDEIAGVPGYRDGTGSNAWFNLPEDITIGPDGSLYVADTGNGMIRRITFNADDEAVVSTMEINGNPPPPAPPAPKPAGSHKGGGGAPGMWLYAGLSLLVLARFTRVRKA
jgi:sugar lactone lactonase YvrE